jgi:glycosyltransferase involved in cell wall biosynthesis
MKIGFILNISLNINGPSNHLIKDIINTFTNDDLFVIQKSIKNDRLITNPNVKSFFINVKSIEKKNLFLRYINDLVYSRKIGKLIKKNNLKFDVIFLQSAPNAYFTVKNIRKYSNAKIVYNVQDLFPDNLFQLNFFNKIKYFIFSFYNKKLFSLVDTIITVSRDIKNSIKRYVRDDNKIKVIYNWAFINSNVDCYQMDFKKKLNIENKKVILYAGNLGIFQNPTILVNVAEKLSNDYCVLIIGDGSQKNKMLRRIKNKNIQNILFLNTQPLEYMNSIYGQADLNFISFQNGIYKTALPSKLSFCLNTSKPIIFTIEKESKICDLLKNDSLTKCLNPKNIDEIISSIDSLIHNKNINNEERQIIVKEYFNRNINPFKYKKYIKELVTDNEDQ